MRKEKISEYILIILIIATILTAIFIFAPENDGGYVYEDVEIIGTVTKQYIEDNVEGKYARTTHEYYTVVDYGGEYLKVVEDKDYYQRHNVGDEVTLIKHRTYTADGKWVETKVSVK